MPGNTHFTARARAVKHTPERYGSPELFPRTERGKRDPNKRRRLLTRAQDLVRVHRRTGGKEGISRGARAVLDALVEKSDKYGKVVWGHQADWVDEDGNEREGLATLAGCSPRQFQRNLKELEDAKIVVVVRTAPERMPDGRVCRPKVNRYHFCIPRAKSNRKPKPSTESSGTPTDPRGDINVGEEPSPSERDRNLSPPAIQIRILDFPEDDPPPDIAPEEARNRLREFARASRRRPRDFASTGEL